jgi:hypothetical protein
MQFLRKLFYGAKICTNPLSKPVKFQHLKNEDSALKSFGVSDHQAARDRGYSDQQVKEDLGFCEQCSTQDFGFIDQQATKDRLCGDRQVIQGLGFSD